MSTVHICLLSKFMSRCSERVHDLAGTEEVGVNKRDTVVVMGTSVALRGSLVSHLALTFRDERSMLAK